MEHLEVFPKRREIKKNVEATQGIPGGTAVWLPKNFPKDLPKKLIVGILKNLLDLEELSNAFQKEFPQELLFSAIPEERPIGILEHLEELPMEYLFKEFSKKLLGDVPREILEKFVELLEDFLMELQKKYPEEFPMNSRKNTWRNSKKNSLRETRWSTLKNSKRNSRTSSLRN